MGDGGTGGGAFRGVWRILGGQVELLPRSANRMPFTVPLWMDEHEWMDIFEWMEGEEDIDIKMRKMKRSGCRAVTSILSSLRYPMGYLDCGTNETPLSEFERCASAELDFFSVQKTAVTEAALSTNEWESHPKTGHNFRLNFSPSPLQLRQILAR